MPDILFSEAGARIIWGEPFSSVRDLLTANGISATDADTKIEEFCAERNTEIRKIGIRNTLISAALVPGAGITFYLCLRLGFSSGFARCAAVCMVGGFYGIWKLYNGIIYLVRPQSGHKSIPNIMESGIID
jgi:hypothetical protein